MPRVIRWPLREALLAYLEWLKEQARRDYEIELMIWGARSPYMKGESGKRPPKRPELLKED